MGKIKVSEYMTECPQSININASLSEAREMMRLGQYRHLPVVENNSIVGILSDRDVKWAYSLGAKDTAKVETAMTPEPVIVGPNATVEEVLPTMIEQRLGCILIEPRGVVPHGIFTTTDALKVLSHVLETTKA